MAQLTSDVAVMVANAGIAPVCPFLEMTPDLLDKTYAVNVRGVFLCYREAAKVMISQGQGGRLIGKCDSVCAIIIPD
jgi:meso-butanediol dehydrogenase/(S,S)-butanediol dehydrogenase/diacetyl reductase